MKKLLFALLFASLLIQAQSVADAARKAQAAKPAEKKATRKFDNDSIRDLSSAGVSTVGKVGAPEEAKPVVEDAKPATKGTRAEAEKAWRARFAELRAQLKAAEVEAADLQVEMNKASPHTVAVDHYYHDVEYIKHLEISIAANNRTRERLKKQIADLEKELRRLGLPSSWAEEN
jgi:chromosome segregation ATPase